MDYKKLIKSRDVRIFIMRMLSFVPDKWMVKLQYCVKTGRKLNLKNPQRFTEKLQWYKLYYRDPVMAQCADKYDVREYVKNCGLEHILNECYGVFDSPDDIDFDKLPNAFVIKDTLGGGGNSVVICKDKEKFDRIECINKLRNWIKPTKGKHPGREWVYDNKRNRIIIEEYIDSKEDEGGLIDYKFFCFQGKVQYVYGIADRTLGNGAGLGIYNADFELLPYQRADERPLQREITKPKNYEKMVEYAEKLSKPFPHARIDLYNQNGKIIFGEITFFDGSGYMKYKPDEFDCIMGKCFIV